MPKNYREHDSGLEEVKSLLMNNYRNTNSLVKLAGSIAFESTGSAPNDTAGSEPARLSPANYSGLDAAPMTTIVGDGEATMTGPDRDRARQVSGNLTDAFRRLAVAGHPNFTISWWARADSSFKQGQFGEWDGFEELVVSDTAASADLLRVSQPLGGLDDWTNARDSNPPLWASDHFGGDFRGQVVFMQGKGLPKGGGWVIQINGAPFCREQDRQCQRSPAFWCQGPAGGAYNGIWRHFALRISNDGLSSQVEMFLDGISLCGVAFGNDVGLLPHLR